jgi:hypothetical protein
MAWVSGQQLQDGKYTIEKELGLRVVVRIFYKQTFTDSGLAEINI